jgi:hypothetical protein
MRTTSNAPTPLPQTAPVVVHKLTDATIDVGGLASEAVLATNEASR